MLLDDFLPEFDVRTSYATRIAASPARAYGSLKTADFDHWGLTRALYAIRALAALPSTPREAWGRFRKELWEHRFTLDDMLVSGFSVIGERPGEELVLGTVGRFWRARGELCAISPVRFREPAPPGTAKAAWNFVVGRCSDGTTELRTETRVLCADVEARRRFRAYWMLIKPFSGLIRCEMLAAVRSAGVRLRLLVFSDKRQLHEAGQRPQPSATERSILDVSRSASGWRRGCYAARYMALLAPGNLRHRRRR